MDMRTTGPELSVPLKSSAGRDAAPPAKRGTSADLGAEAGPPLGTVALRSFSKEHATSHIDWQGEVTAGDYLSADAYVRTKRILWLTALIALLYWTLAIGRVRSSEPWNDEAWYTSPSLNLVQHGNTGTPLLETQGKFWRGIDQRTYWVVPLQFFIQVPWIKTFGFSLFTMRMYAATWGFAALLAWGAIVWLLTRDEWAALLTMLFLACDFQFVSQTALARMDAQALAFAALAILSFLYLRTRNLHAAVFCSQLAVVASGLTHPTAGGPAFAAVLVLTLFLDGRKLRWLDGLAAAAAYGLGIAFWGWYISEAPDLFKAQFFGNVTDINRLGGFTHPFQAMVREFGRYAGMGGFAPGMPLLYRMKIIVIAVYLLAVVALFRSRIFRELRGVRVLMLLWAVYFLAMTFYDNTKEVKYGLHIVPLYLSVIAVWTVAWLRSGTGKLQRCSAALAATALVVIGTGGLVMTAIKKNDYHDRYLPAARFLQRSAGPNDLILAGSEFGFALGFDRSIIDDNDFTYISRKQPAYIVMSHGYRGSLAHLEQTRPAQAEYFETMLLDQYRVVYNEGDYQIYKKIG